MAALVSKSLKELLDHIDYICCKMFTETGEIDLTECLDVLENYYGTDWHNFMKDNLNEAIKDKNRGCTEMPINIKGRKYVHFDAWLTCWHKGANSGIHDYSSNGCIQRILGGVLRETRYNKGDGKFEIVDEIKLRQGNVIFIDKDKGLHRIENKSLNNDAFTLHVYSPPNFKTRYYISEGNSEGESSEDE